MPFIGVLVTITIAFGAAMLTGRRWLLLVPAAAWSLFFLTLLSGVLGTTVGDAWQLAFLIDVFVTTAIVAVGLLLHRVFFSSRAGE